MTCSKPVSIDLLLSALDEQFETALQVRDMLVDFSGSADGQRQTGNKRLALAGVLGEGSNAASAGAMTAHPRRSPPESG